MAAFVDWPSLKKNVRDGEFPFEVIVGQGAGVFPWVYLAMGLMVLTSGGLAWIHWPADAGGQALLAAKAAALSFMIGSTVYGTLRTWPKLQFATDEDAFRIYGRYVIRAYIIFGCGVVGHVAGIVFSRRFMWFG